MTEVQNPGGSQLPVARGTLRLFSPSLPELICRLTHLSPNGCRATVRLQYLPPELAGQWRQVLTPQNALRVGIESQPGLGTLELDALCIRMAQSPLHCELEFRFQQLTPDQAALLAPAAAPPQDPGRPPPDEVPPHARFTPAPELPPPDGPPLEQVPTAQAAKPQAPTRQFRRIGEVLVQMGKLRAEQAEDAAARARSSGEKLGQVLLRTGLVSPSVLCRALALQSGLPMTDLEAEEIPEELAKLFPYDLMARHEFVPFDDAGAFVCIAVPNALAPAAVKELEKACHKHVEVFLAREDLIRKELHVLRHRLEAPPRLHIRYEASYPIEYQFCTRLGVLAEHSSHQGTTLNISEGGFLVDGPAVELGTPEDLLRIGMCATIVLAPGTQHEFRGLCRIKSLKPQGKRCALALEVLGASADDRRRLKELCVEAVRAQARHPPA